MKFTCNNCRPAQCEEKCLGLLGIAQCWKCGVDCSQDPKYGVALGGYYVDTSVIGPKPELAIDPPTQVSDCVKKVYFDGFPTAEQIARAYE